VCGLGGSSNKEVVVEQAVIVHLRLRDSEFGSPEERESVCDLEDQLREAIESALSGEFDGDDFGQGTCILYMYGEDADKLFATVEPIFRSSPLAAGGYAIKRYGDASDPHASEVRVNFAP
jgi:hypothetical protein